MEEDAFLYTPNRFLLEKSLKVVEETRALVAEYQARDDALAQREEKLRGQLKGIEFQRSELKYMLEEAKLSLERIENNVHRLKSISDTYPSRQLKQSTQLWDCVLVLTSSLRITDEETSSGHLSSIRHWIASGRQETQSLFIDDYDPTLGSDVYTALRSTTPTWKSIIMSVKADDPPTAWNIDEIRSSNVTVCLYHSESTVNPLIPLLRQATNLKMVGVLPPWGNMPWVSLRSLTIASFLGATPFSYPDFGAEELRSILDAAVHLEVLELNFDMEKDILNISATQNREHVRHVALKSLAFSLHHLEEDGCLFGVQIDAPLLQQVSILSADQAKLDENPSQIQMWQGVTSVTVHDITNGEVTALVHFLRCLPKVTSIDVQGNCIDALFTLVNGFYTHIPPKFATIPLLNLTKVTMNQTDIQEGFQTWTLIDDFPTPVLLGSVCSRWYHIVKQNTKLWNSILIRTGALPEWVGEDDEENNNAHFHNIRHWIASGRQENQSLFINDYDPLAISSIYATLKPTGPSWKAIIIDVKVDHGSMSWDIEKIRAEQVIVCLPKERPHTMNQLLPLLRQASHLIIMGALPPWGDMPWVALRKLELTPFASDDPGSVIFGAYALRTIFDAALHLETLSLNFHVAHQTPDDYVANHQEKLGHGALKFLGFPLHHLEEDGRLFGVQIDAPLLQHVTLFSYNGARLSENPSKVETWQGVTSVALYEIIDDEVLPTVQFLRCLPEVISIDVQGRNVEALFTLMTGFYAHIPPKYATIPLPKLTEVTMRGADIKGKTLIEMLEMRLAQLESGLNWISAIEYVTLYGADNVTLDEWKRVNTLLENGRVVSIPDAAAMAADELQNQLVQRSGITCEDVSRKRSASSTESLAKLESQPRRRLDKMEADAFLYAPNRALLEKSLKITEETRVLVEEYQARGEALTQREKRLRDQLKDIEFQRLQLNEILEEAELSLERMEKNTWDSIEHFTTPILLGSVCSHWRAIVKQNAKLWGTILIRAPIFLKVEGPGEKKNDDHVQSIRHWMAYGKQDRQSVFIDKYEPRANPKVYAALESTSPSWKSITIAITKDDPSLLWEIDKVRASYISIYAGRSEPNMHSVMPLLRYAAELSLSGSLPPWGDTPWTSLRILSLFTFTDNESNFLEFGGDEIRSILDAAIHLEKLMLDFFVTHGTSEMEREEVGHQALRSLSFHLNHLQADGSLFGIQINAPRLNHVRVLSAEVTSFDEGLTQIEAFQNVTSVTIEDIDMHEVQAIARFLRNLPKATSIDIQGRNVDALFTLINGFYHHIPPKYSTIPLPKLTKVTMENTDIRGNTLIAMLETRLAQLERGSGLVSVVTDVTLYETDNVTPEEWKRVNKLLESGRQASLPDTAAMRLS
ncbi:hypothetical protein M408DRAFT_321329 [Serendipita vermifera MAFF 305830]|uniref:Uncharacterized protein n=1 Tax=Serendipita vermifera MAFF 305830 TaxID=933852 RepID=A0A0C3AVE4_SERVB|nr:hypothetical protein M408DRAFT_321329 [Serendipita vermifera MAFF 305830]